MLVVYTHSISKPKDCFDLSETPLDELCDVAVDIYRHQKTGHIWFGYLDGWMITPREEVLLRKVIRKFQCTAISHFPLAFSLAWKNEIEWVYTTKVNGDSNTHNNGRTLLDGCSS